MLALPLCAPTAMSGGSRFSTSFQHLVLSLSWVLDSLICIYRNISLVLFLRIRSLHPLGSPRKRPPLQLKCPDKAAPYSCALMTAGASALARTWIWFIWMQVVTESFLPWLGSNFSLLWLVSFIKKKKSFQRKWRGKGPDTSIPECSRAFIHTKVLQSVRESKQLLRTLTCWRAKNI